MREFRVGQIRQRIELLEQASVSAAPDFTEDRNNKSRNKNQNWTSEYLDHSFAGIEHRIKSVGRFCQRTRLYFNATEINEIEDLLRRADDLVGELAIFEIERESGKSIDTNLHNETFRELLAVSNKVLESYERARQQALYRLYIKLQTETGV